MGAPESARLLGRTPEYWLEHMGRERTIQAALRLHHDASLIMTNIQVMYQLATSFSRAASEVMRTVHDREPFPTDADAEYDGRPTKWQLWAYGDRPALQSFRVQCRHHRVIPVWLVMTVSWTGENRTIMPQGYELCWIRPLMLCVIFIEFYV